MQRYDKTSKWLIQHHGDSILRLAGIGDIDSWKALQAELVQNRRLPDGLIEVWRHGKKEPNLFILEVSTYPYWRLSKQIMRGAALVVLDRDILPEVVSLVLHPKGNARVAESAHLQSRLGLTDWRLSWKTVKLWTLPAEELLAAGDVGLIPWVPLTQFEGRPEAILRECRARIDRIAPPGEHENLLAVLQILASLRYNDRKLLELLGGRHAMIESPVLRELREEWTLEGKREGKIEGKIEGERAAIAKVLEARWGVAPPDAEAELKRIPSDRLDEVLKSAATAPSLASFRKRVSKLNA